MALFSLLWKITPPAPFVVALRQLISNRLLEGKAAITGDFVLIASEVNPVIKALRDGIEVTALHSHMLTDTPHLCFMHFWPNDDGQKLARGLRAALDKVNVKKG